MLRLAGCTRDGVGAKGAVTEQKKKKKNLLVSSSYTLGTTSLDFSWGGFYAIAHQVIGMRVKQSFKWVKNGEKSREVNEFSCISTLLWFSFEILELQHRLNELLWRDDV